MKKFTKLFLSCVAAAALTTAVAATAMAAGEVAVSYDKDAKAITLTTNYEAAQKTMLVLPKAVKLDAATKDDIIQIDQKDAYTTAIPVGELADGTYTVYMGGAGSVYTADFTVGDGKVILMGDVNGADGVNAQDAALTLGHYVGNNTLTGDFLAAADVNQADGVNSQDAAMILTAYVSGPGASSGYAGQNCTVDVTTGKVINVVSAE